jgi:hypothetical protein
MNRHLVFVGILSLLVAAPVTAQQRSAPFERWESALPASDHISSSPALPHREEARRRDYRYEGLALGGAFFGTLGTVVGYGLSYACPTEAGVKCEPDRLGNAVVLGFAGAAVGGGLGFLIGLLSPKPEPGS